MIRFATSAALCAVTFVGGTAAQDLLPKAAPQSRPIVLHDATIHTVADGIVLGGTIWFADGKIRQILPAGEEPQLPAGGEEPLRIDLDGRNVFPGMISVGTALGLIEIGAVPQSVDTDELDELSPEAIAATAVNPDSAAIPVTRLNGVLAALVLPADGLLPGRASVLQLDGWTNADMALRRDAGVVVDWPSARARGFRRSARPGGDDDTDERARERRQRIDDAFVDAQAWQRAREADAQVPLDIRHAALVPALRGEAPVFVLADDAEQIESAVLWGTSRALRLVIVGGHEARAVAGLLKQHDVPVVVDGVHRLPRREDAPYDEPFTLPRDLHRAGVRFCIATGDEYWNDRNLPYHAATAAAYGLDRGEALAAITRRAAEIIGVGDRIGSLREGMDATLFVSDGHPFELTSKVEMAFVQGRRVELRSKQTELADKYRERYRQLRDR